jgi:hypothetical protein
LLNTRMPALKSQALVGASLFVLALLLAWAIGGRIVADDARTLTFGVLVLAGCAVAIAILRNWRVGFYLFFIWMMFEDLVRKYMGNGSALFFGKDVLLMFVYIAFYMEVRRGREKTFRPPFMLFLSLFFWLGVLQVFNQNSPHILYGLLGLKLYFYYIPLLFVGYALIRTDEDLRKFLVVSAVLAGVIGALGIAQAILGNTFLNPAKLAPELEDLGDLSKVSPLSGHAFSLPSSVFVSSGRFAVYLTVASILAMATAAYLLFYTRRNRKLVFVIVGVLGVATLLSGSRTAFVSVSGSAIVLSAGFLWGAPWRQRQAHRTMRAIRRSAIVAALALAAVLMIYPEEAGSRLAYYTETLNPSSAAYEGSTRSWAYPISGLVQAFTRPHWELGNGIGTASLGGQYVAKLLGTRTLDIWVEEGYGQMIIEMGIVAPFLWILWTGALLYYSWKVVRTLRGTRLFPVGLGILWYAFVLLYPFTYATLAIYQNYVCNAYLWLLIGILFRLPELLRTAPAAVRLPSRRASDMAQMQP